MHAPPHSCPHWQGDSNAARTDTHDLLNEATQWQQYARGLAELLAELVHESDAVDCARMALGLEAIGAICRLAAQRTAEAHAQLTWDRSKISSGSILSA